MNKKLISVVFYSELGFLKKPDTNDGIYLTYNCLHKPALLGILGAIIGLGGYYQAYSKERDSLPEYYQKLQHLEVGIEPINSERGDFQKTVITYNNGVGYASEEEGGNLIVREQTLVKPGYRVYLLLDPGNDIESILYEMLENNTAEYIPYLGKNEFQLNWNQFTIYEYEEFGYTSSYQIADLFKKEMIIKQFRRARESPDLPPFYAYFERLPIGYNDKIKNYVIEEFAYSNYEFPAEHIVDKIYELKSNSTGEKIFVQLY